MNRYFRLLCMLLALGLLLSACALSEDAPAETAAPLTTATPIEDVVIATVNDVEIYRSDYIPVFDYYYGMYSSYFGADFSDEAMLHSLQDTVLTALVQSEVLKMQAAAQGIELDSADLQKVEQSYQSLYDSLIAGYEERATAEGAANANARALEILTEELAKNGDTLESHLANMRADIEDTERITKLQKSVFDTVTVSEVDVRARFDEELAKQQSSYTLNPATFNSAMSNFESAGGIPPLYTPEGFRRVKHILVSINDTRTEADALKLANELHARVTTGGEDFDAVMAEAGEDPGMKAEPNMSRGYLTYSGTNFVPEFLETSLALAAVGDISEPVKTSHGYHIIKLVELLESGPKAFEDVRESYTNSTLDALQQEAFAQKVDEWTKAVNVTSYAERIRDLGAIG